MPAASSPPARVPQFIGRVPPWSLESTVVPPAFPWPTAASTGYQNAPGYPGSLTPYSGGAITSNTTYTYQLFTDATLVGTSSSSVSNVTFIGCAFTNSGNGAPNVLLYGDNITFSYCTVAPSGFVQPPVSFADGYQYGIEADGSFSTFADQLLVQYCNLWGFAEGIDVTGGTQAKPHVYQHNYIHDACADGGVYHIDGLGAQSGSGTEDHCIIYNNNIQSAGNTNGIAYQGGTYSNMMITDNLLGGWGYTVQVSGTLSNITFTGNTYSTAILPAFGPLYSTAMATSPGCVWQQNIWYVPPGAQWGHTQYNGYFWLPQSISDASPSLDELAAGLVSLTDY